MSDSVYILFRTNPQTGLSEVRGVVTKESSMRSFIDEETRECRSAEQWGLDALTQTGKTKMGEFSNET